MVTAQRWRWPGVVMLLALAACNGPPQDKQQDAQASRDATARSIINDTRTTPDGTSVADSLEAYKVELARRIAAVNSQQVTIERPQALLRAVIVIRYEVDRDGRLLRSVILRSNHDKQAEATALGSLQHSAPFPKPSAALLRQHKGSIELSETWLFNDDGRFQLRSLAQAQRGSEPE